MQKNGHGVFLSTVLAVERVVVIALLVLMLTVVLLSTVELVVLIFQEVTDSSRGLIFLEISELLDIFGFFFLILIGIELLETIKMYLNDQTVHVEVVLLVALIAAARKVIVLDLNAYQPVAVLGLAALMLALAAAYFLIKWSHGHTVQGSPPSEFLTTHGEGE